jgi:hypothetical protein
VREQGSRTKSQLRHNNGTDEQRFGCNAKGRRAHVPGCTTPGARHARPSGYSRLSEKRARYLWLIAQGNHADGIKVTPITVVDSNDPELLENLIDMAEIYAE